MTNFFKITDERFSKDRTDFYDLVFEVQFSRFRFLIQSNDSVIWLEDYYLGSKNNLETTSEKIREIITNHAFLNITFWKSIRIISAFEVNTILTENNHEICKNDEYIKICFPSIELNNFTIFSQNIKKNVIVFALVKSINQIFISQYPESKLQFTSTAAVSLGHQNSSDLTTSVCLVTESFVDIIRENPKTKTLKSDRILTRNINNLNQSSEDVVLYGEVTPYSPMYGVLREKFKGITMGKTPNEEKLSAQLSEIASQRYFTLLASL